MTCKEHPKYELPNTPHAKHRYESAMKHVEAAKTARKTSKEIHPIIKKLNERNTPKDLNLWGANARSKKQYITNPIHYVIESAHPSPLSAYNGFFGSKPFSRTNEFLEKNGIAPIEWEIKD